MSVSNSKVLPGGRSGAISTWPVLLAYALSGAAALVYEITWARQLTLTLGHTSAATSTVLAAFMGGMAAGSLLAGRPAERLHHRIALRWYALMEALIALSAVLLPLELAAARPLLGWMYGDAGGTSFAIVRAVVAFVAVSIPAIAIGATFPLVVRGCPTVRAATLYAVNTCGAAVGAAAAGLLLVPRLGNGRTIAAAAATSVIAAGLATRASARVADDTAGRPPRGAKARPANEASVHPLPAGLALAATSGLFMFTCEVVWTRLLALICGPSTYAFASMTAAVILALALGAWIGAAMAARSRAPLLLASAALGLGAIASLFSAGRIDAAVLAVAMRATEASGNFASVLRMEMTIAAEMLGPIALATGAVLPLVLAAAGATASRARRAALVLAVNTAGAIAGSLGAGFLLIARAGLSGTLHLAAAVALVVAVCAMPWGRGWGRSAAVAVPLISLFAIVWPSASWTQALVSAGAYRRTSAREGVPLDVQLTAGTLLFYGEDAAATVAVREENGARSLAIDGKVDASDAGDMLTQRLLAHVPLLLTPGAKYVAIVGLGSGVTVSSALAHPVSAVDVIEISPLVLRAAPLFAARQNQPLTDSRVHVIVGDARTHFALTRRRYDVIISEPSNPWMAGVAALFTREFFESVRDHLTSGGVVCQWAHTYEMSIDDVRSILATFHSVFPHVSVWLVGDADLLLLGSSRPLAALMDEKTTEWTTAHRDMADVGVTSPDALRLLFRGAERFVEGWAGGAAIQRDDRQALEFTAPFAVGRRDSGVAENMRQAADRLDPEPRRRAAAMPPATLRDAGLMLLGAEAPRPAFSLLRQAVYGAPADAAAWRGLVRAAGALGRLAEAEGLLTEVMAKRPNLLAPRLEYARLLAARGNVQAAFRIAEDALQTTPSSADAASVLASIAEDAGDDQGLEAWCRRLEALAPASYDALYYRAALDFRRGNASDAASFARRALDVTPDRAEAWTLLGAAIATQGLPGTRAQAREAFRRAVHLDPFDPAPYRNLAALELEAGNVNEAINWLTQAAAVSPGDDGLRRAIADALSRKQSGI